jgi:hypothetical protein
VAVDVRATQATGFVEMRAGAFEQFAASAKEAFAARSQGAGRGAVHRGGVGAGTLRFDEVVEAVLSQQLIQPTIEG